MGDPVIGSGGSEIRLKPSDFGEIWVFKHVLLIPRGKYTAPYYLLEYILQGRESSEINYIF